MALPSSGSISANAINQELLRSPTAAFSMNELTVRMLAQRYSGIISFSDFRGKSFDDGGRPLIWTGDTTIGPTGGNTSITLKVMSNRNWSATWSFGQAGNGTGGSWSNSSTSDNTEVRWTHTSGDYPNIGKPENSWQLLSSGDFSVGVSVVGTQTTRILLEFRRGSYTFGTQSISLRT